MVKMQTNSNNNETAAVMFASMHIKMARPGNNVKKKPEKIQNYSRKRF